MLMGQVRVIFNEPQQIGAVTLREMTVDADRLVLLANGEVTLDVATATVRTVDGGAAERTARMRSANRNHGRAWSAYEEIELARLWDSKSTAELAAHFGRSRGAITSAARRLKLPERATGSTVTRQDG
ncbi:hypothetical protein [Actinomadura sp. WAC 06369]|uniref:hypothetical protein n=1 Tax=Actinomadura sp. WAC 06369 TaxID=2203193 RepID=UPI000F7A1908|nr:hypothetical protein [Actinomadura sp. WAC 06369]RSN43336.1 hypothetical protein DMH08_37920 [Actinomadura sp. WAC 06369]